MDPLAALPSDPAAWEALARCLDGAARWKLGQSIAHEWIEGRLEPRLRGNATRDVLTTLRRHLSRALDACGITDDFAIEWGGPNVDESLARRWCWIAPWTLLSQDEDLLLMDDHES